MRWLLTIIFLVWVIPAQADDKLPTVRYTLPKVETEHREDGDYKCLNTKQWQTVLLMGRGFHGLYDWRLKIQGTINAHAILVTGLEKVIVNLELQIKIHERDVTYWKVRLKQSEESKANAVFASKIEKYAYLVAIVLETGIIAYMGVKGLAN